MQVNENEFEKKESDHSLLYTKMIVHDKQTYNLSRLVSMEEKQQFSRIFMSTIISHNVNIMIYHSYKYKNSNKWDV